MNEELEQSNVNQEQLLEGLEANQDQLIEIYKLHTQLANNIINRRMTINRFYMLLMSGLALIFPAFSKLPTEIRELISTEYLIMGVPLLGIVLSVTWFASINSNLRQGVIKYEVLKKLEDKLDYQFFKDEWRFLEKYRIGKTYWEASYIETLIPFLFFLIFMFLFHLGEKTFPDKSRNELITTLASCTGVLAGIFGHEGVRSLVIDWEIRGFMKGWSDRTVKLVTTFVPALTLIVISAGGLFLLRFTGCN